MGSTALVLLFLLAMAALPGALLPQRTPSPNAVTDYFTRHPDLAPVLDKLGAFDVFATPWFSAIYLLLFISLVGCLVPRSLAQLRGLRAQPVAVPRNLARLPHHAATTTDATPDEVVAAVCGQLGGRGLTGRWGLGWKVAVREESDGVRTISAEKGDAGPATSPSTAADPPTSTSPTARTARPARAGRPRSRAATGPPPRRPRRGSGPRPPRSRLPAPRPIPELRRPPGPGLPIRAARRRSHPRRQNARRRR